VLDADERAELERLRQENAELRLEDGWVGGWRGDAVAFRFQSPPVEPCVRLSGSKLSAHQHATGETGHGSQRRPAIPDGRISRVRF
jgi:hypothetical protein